MDSAIVRLDGQYHARFQVSLSAPGDGFFRLADGNRTILRNGRGYFERFRLGLAGWDEVIDQANRFGFWRWYTTPGKNHLLGKRCADNAWQELSAANAR